MKRLVKVLVLPLLFLFTFVVHTYHVGVFPKPDISQLKLDTIDKSTWIPRQQAGIHQLVVSGSSYEIGYRGGQHTSQLMKLEELELLKTLRQFLPHEYMLRGLILLAINWFDGVEPFFEPWMVQEMYGTSLSASDEFDYLADPFSRQIAYHGIHEIGQMMVDQGSDDMGCTVVAVPFKNSWILGRNFDFEGGRIFDREKIVKWVFPENKNAYVSVIWAGMVGAVTAVNEKGIYISLNAAGSRDFRRFGTPSTLVLAKALREANTATEAIKIITEATMFITDIFVLEDSKSGELYRIEKSPLHTEVIRLKDRSIVTNHLISDNWKEDAINIYRKNELTSGFREARGVELLNSLKLTPETTAPELETKILSILRDKGFSNGKSLDLGNRRAIDSLIAAHSVVYNAKEGRLYVGEGPGVSGAFLGYDLDASFKNRSPVRIEALLPDPLVSPKIFAEVKASAQTSGEVVSLAKHRQCLEARKALEEIPTSAREHSSYYIALGFTLSCEKKEQESKLAFTHALELIPAYPHVVRELEEKLK